ncbi:hypothetical protein GF351_00785 [Candidatus Woesearchaeota archaeon]|nr:hypothetical protein [Candidatus Woesearchaeota archaeon]
MDPIGMLRSYTGHEHIFLADRGNSAILAALETANRRYPGRMTALYPDQGGWLSYRKSAKKVNSFEPEKVKTDAGIIDLENLKKKAGDAYCFIYQNPAGYFADQPIKEIYRICRGVCTAILDVTGCIGDKELCDGRFADMMVGSFGRWKPVNLGYGGFISFRDKETAQQAGPFLKSLRFEKEHEAELLKKLQELPERLEFLYNTTQKVKQELSQFDIVQPGKKGINVVVRWRDGEEKKRIINYCDVKGYEYTECPRYIRLNDDAISIEIKRLTRDA